MPARKKIDLDQIEEEVKKESVEPKGNSFNEAEELDKEIERQFKREQIKTWQLYNSTLNTNAIERKKYAWYIFSLTCVWALLIFIFIFLQAIKCFSLSEKVLIALITTTTINFFGFFLLVTKYLFNINEHKLMGDKSLQQKKFSSKKKKVNNQT
ncbi:hypothetical protein [Pedobacter miscanthi]|uniref:2TM domain-containing protein n=1 Tax=Pedobacter miscanthi TaxID=2259170 RepID=A0A366KXH7_9SPHI|nr:hypothetical protein [Pedobacter miscanthi]RBQ06258.1 hypothetical protein DRW42_14315 [Pedobacter miscanthi]